MARRGLVWLAIVVPVAALCVAGLLFLFRDPVLRSLELPVAYLLWFARVAAVVVGQRIVWAALVLIAAIYGLASLRSRGATRRRSVLLPRHEASRTRISFWENCLSRDQQSWLSRQLLAADLRRLVLRVLEHTEGIEASELEHGLERGEIDLPVCLQQLFQREQEPRPERRSVLRRLFRASRQPGQIRNERDVAEIVSALERRLSLSAKLPRTER